MAQLFDGQTANGNSTTEAWSGGNGTIFVEGDLDGANVTLEWQKTSSDWYSVDTLTTGIDQPRMVAFFAGECTLRVKLSNAGSNTDVDVSINA